MILINKHFLPGCAIYKVCLIIGKKMPRDHVLNIYEEDARGVIATFIRFYLENYD